MRKRILFTLSDSLSEVRLCEGRSRRIKPYFDLGRSRERTDLNKQGLKRHEGEFSEMQVEERLRSKNRTHLEFSLRYFVVEVLHDEPGSLCRGPASSSDWSGT